MSATNEQEAQTIPVQALQPQPVYVVQQSRPYNGLAIAGLVLSLLWGYGLLSVLAVIFCAASFRQIREEDQGGKGLAIAGLVIGIIGATVTFLVLVAGAIASST